MRKASTQGFTLLEVLVAVTLLSMITSIVYANFSIGIRSYKRGTARGDLFQDARSGMRLIEADMARMIPGKGGETSFTNSSMSFNALQEGQETRMVKVMYTVSGGTLARSLSSAAGQEGKEGETGDSSSFVLAEGVKDGAFEFFDGENWLQEIKEEDKTKKFLAARLKMTLQSGDDEGVFRTVFLLPAERELEKSSAKKEDAK